jgi:hypothetical protein
MSLVPDARAAGKRRHESTRKSVVGEFRVSVIVRDFGHFFTRAADDISGVGITRDFRRAVPFAPLAIFLGVRLLLRHITSC